MRNIPYVKHFDAAGELINPILFKYSNNGPNRKQRRLDDKTTSTRPFNNKKGMQIIVTKIGPYAFMKWERTVIQQGSGTRVLFRQR